MKSVHSKGLSRFIMLNSLCFPTASLVQAVGTSLPHSTRTGCCLLSETLSTRWQVSEKLKGKAWKDNVRSIVPEWQEITAHLLHVPRAQWPGTGCQNPRGSAGSGPASGSAASAEHLRKSLLPFVHSHSWSLYLMLGCACVFPSLLASLAGEWG